MPRQRRRNARPSRRAPSDSTRCASCASRSAPTAGPEAAARDGAVRGPGCRGRRAGRGGRAARPHPRRSGGDRAARAGARQRGRELAGHGAGSRPVPAAAARHPASDHRAGLRRRRTRAVGRPAQRRPRLHAGARAAERAARCWRPSSAPASPRPSPAPPSSCARTPTPSTRSPRRSPRTSPSSTRPASRCRVAALAANPPALRQRLIRLVGASEFHVSLSRAQTLAVARLVTDWHGQEAVDLPGVHAERRGRIHLVSRRRDAHRRSRRTTTDPGGRAVETGRWTWSPLTSPTT